MAEEMSNEIVVADSPQALATTDHTSKMLITDQEAMERLWQGVDIAVQRAEDAIPAAGINLLRGTRDFTEGSKNRVFNSFEDGFNGLSQQVFSISYDEQGFGVLTISSTAQWQGPYSSYVIISSQLQSDYVTLSFYFYLHSDSIVDEYTRIVSIAQMKKDNTRRKYISYNARELTGKDTVPHNKWIHAVVSFEVDKGIEDGEYFYVKTEISSVGAKVSYKKLKFEWGDIANPTWSASPFDVAQGLALGIGPVERILPSSNIRLSDSMFLNPGRWIIGSDEIKYVEDLPSNIPTNYIVITTQCTFTDYTQLMQEVVQPRTGRKYMRLIQSGSVYTNGWYEYAFNTVASKG